MRRMSLIAVGIALLALVVALTVFWLVYRGLVSSQEQGQIVNEDSSQVLATVNGVAITRNMAEREVKVSRFNVIDPHPSLEGADLDQAMEEAVNQIITRQLILQAATQQNFRLTDEFVVEQVDLLFGTYGAEVLNKAMEQADITYPDLVWWAREIFTVEEFTTQVIMAEANPEERQAVYNAWLNDQRAKADIQIIWQDSLPALEGQLAPNFTLFTPDGQSISLADYRGRVVLINFWATWCPSCVTEMPEYEQLYQHYGAEKLIVLGVNLQEGAEHAAQYAAGLGVTYPVLLDQDGQVTTHQYQATGMPASFIIDQEGRIFYRHLGPLSSATLAEKLAQLGF